MSDVAMQLPDLVESERIRRYVRGELAKEELQQFERKLLVDSLLQDRVEAEFALSDHAEALAATAPAARNFGGQLSALAASLIIGLAGGVVLSKAWHGPAGGARQIETISFTRMRSNAPAPRFVAPAGIPLAARFLTESDEPHRLQIRAQSGALRADIEDLRPNPDGDLAVLLPAFSVSDSPMQIRLISAAQVDEFELILSSH